MILRKVSLFVLFFLIVTGMEAHCGAKKAPDIFAAVKSGDIDEVKRVIEIDPNCLSKKRNIGFVPGYTPLHIAASRGDHKMVLFILEWGLKADIRAQDGKTPLHMAAMNGLNDDYAETVIALLKYKADLNAADRYRQTPLDLAMHYCNIEMIDFLSMLGGRRGRLHESLDTPEIEP